MIQSKRVDSFAALAQSFKAVEQVVLDSPRKAPPQEEIVGRPLGTTSTQDEARPKEEQFVHVRDVTGLREMVEQIDTATPGQVTPMPPARMGLGVPVLSTLFPVQAPRPHITAQSTTSGE